MNPLLAYDDSEDARRQALLGMIGQRQLEALPEVSAGSDPRNLPVIRPLIDQLKHMGETAPHLWEGLKRYPQHLLGQVQDAVTAPTRALTGELQVRDPETGMPSDEAMGSAGLMAGLMMGGGMAGTKAKPHGALGIFGGRNAKTANLPALAKAEAMAAQGIDRQTIWDETQWAQGADGKWRFEVDDSKAVAKPPSEWSWGNREDFKRGGKTVGPVNEFFQHDELARAYPDIMGVNESGNRATMSVRPNESAGGSYGDDDHISVGLFDGLPNRSTTLHELQHAVEEREGFAQGGSVKDFTYQNSPLFQHRKSYEEPLDAYKRLAGEAEARNVQTRRDFTPEERKSRPPWETQDVPDDQQIVRFRSEGPQQSIGNPLLRSDLPMDEASRMARARELGYSDEQFFHGTNAPVENFDKRGKGNGMTFGTKERAVFLTDNPAVADSYLSGGYVRADAPAALEHGTAPMPGNNVARYYSEGANVMPLRVRDLDKFEVWDMGGAGYRDGHMEQALKEARKNKAPGVIFENIRDPGVLDVVGPVGSPRTPSRTVAVLDPRVLRSPAAKFDPANEGKSFLLGSGSTDSKSAAANAGLLGALNEKQAVGNPLLMDEASRVGRAREQGFNPDETLYHATPYSFDEFVPSSWRGASYFSKSPDGAMRGMGAGGNEHPALSGPTVGGAERVGANVLPVHVRGKTWGKDPMPLEWFPEKLTYGEYRDIIDGKNPIKIEGMTEAQNRSLNVERQRQMSLIYDEAVPVSEYHKFTGDKERDLPLKRSKDPVAEPFGWEGIEGAPGTSSGGAERREMLQKLGYPNWMVSDEGGISLAASDPANIRSKFAKFDPANEGSGFLLGSGATDSKSAAATSGLLSSLNEKKAIGNPLLSDGKEPIRAFHGSPHDFDKFSLDKIGTGEGAQAYGHGLYFAENEGVARSYRDALAGQNTKWMYGDEALSDGTPRHNAVSILDWAKGDKDKALAHVKVSRMSRMADQKYLDETERAIMEMDPAKVKVTQDAGRMYEVAIKADPDRFLDWDAPLSGQHPAVAERVRAIGAGRHDEETPYDMLNNLVRGKFNNPDNSAKAARASHALKEAGIPGIKYKDAGSRGADGNSGTRNYVVFDDSVVQIIRKYGIAGLAMLPPAIAAQVQAHMEAGGEI